MVVNIILNAVLIFGLLGFPKLGIAGAALATVIARVIEVTWCVLETAKKDSVKLRFYHIIHDDKLFRHDFWKYTTLVLCNEIVWGVGFTMYSVIMGHLGTDAVAANSIANIVKDLVACFCSGLASGGAIIVGNELGGGGDTKFGLLCDTIAMWCIIVPLGFLAAFVLKPPVLVVYFTR